MMNILDIRPASTYKHDGNGHVYAVLMITNTKEPARAGFIPTVVYIDEDAQVYSRFSDDFARRFTVVTEDQPDLLRKAFSIVHRLDETMAHRFFAALPVGTERIRMGEIYENIRTAGRVA